MDGIAIIIIIFGFCELAGITQRAATPLRGFHVFLKPEVLAK
jgi:hypothetical protein